MLQSFDDLDPNIHNTLERYRPSEGHQEALQRHAKLLHHDVVKLLPLKFVNLGDAIGSAHKLVFI